MLKLVSQNMLRIQISLAAHGSMNADFVIDEYRFCVQDLLFGLVYTIYIDTLYFSKHTQRAAFDYLLVGKTQHTARACHASLGKHVGTSTHLTR